MNIPGNETGGVSFAECKLTCGSDLQIWPKINGHFNKTKVARYCHFSPVKITQTVSDLTFTSDVHIGRYPLKKYLTSADVHFNLTRKISSF